MTGVCDAWEVSGSPYISNSQHCHSALLLAVDSVTASGAHIDRRVDRVFPLVRCLDVFGLAE